MSPTRRVSTMSLLTWTAAVIAVAVPVSIAPAQAAGEVNVYSSRHYKADRDLYKRFRAKTGIKVNVVQGKANALFERLNPRSRQT